jgi:hypothetical protein
MKSETEQNLNTDVRWLSGLLNGWTTGTMTRHERIVQAAKDLKVTLDKYLVETDGRQTHEWDMGPQPEDAEVIRKLMADPSGVLGYGPLPHGWVRVTPEQPEASGGERGVDTDRS